MQVPVTYSSLGDFIHSPKCAAQASKLYVLSVLYLILPCFIFLFGFTRWYVILSAGLGLALAAILDAKYELSRTKFADGWWAGIKWFLLILIAAGLWTSLFGAGFVGPQTGDQLKNHMIYRDLFEYSWPVIYPDMPSEMSFLSYSLGYYLVPALIGKGFGWTIGSLSIFLWTALGIALLWSWFCVLFSWFAVFAILVFIFFSGLDILGLVVLGQGSPAAGSHIEWWSGWTFLQYSSNATVMSWSTQHGAAQWLFPMLLFYRLVILREVRGSALLVSIAALWSHLTLLGAVVFLPLYLKEKGIIKFFKDPSLMAVPFLSVVAIFYASKAPGAIDMGFIWELWPIGEVLPKLLWFYIFEFGILALIIFSTRSNWTNDEKLIFVSSILVLLLVPIFHIGWSNDVSMRVSAIPLFILFLIFCLSIREAFLHENRTGISVALLYMLIAMFTPANEMFRQFQQINATTSFVMNLTDINWERGVKRELRNCFITQANQDVDVKVGDTVVVKGVGTFNVSETFVNWIYRNVCVSPVTAVITQRPVGPRSLTFFRNGKKLGGESHFYSSLQPGDIPSITTMWPQQYTGSQNSFFYNFFLNQKQ